MLTRHLFINGSLVDMSPVRLSVQGAGVCFYVDEDSLELWTCLLGAT